LRSSRALFALVNDSVSISYEFVESMAKTYAMGFMKNDEWILDTCFSSNATKFSISYEFV